MTLFSMIKYRRLIQPIDYGAELERLACFRTVT